MKRTFLNLDAGESIFFARELEHVLTRVHMIDYPELKARLFIPVNNEAGPGADSITYYQFDKVGMAKIISDYADDLPRADAFGQKFTSPVEMLGISFGFSIDEIQKSAQAGRSLPTMKADAARRAYEQAVDDIAAVGDTVTGLTGFINNANVTAASALNGDWDNVSADQIIEDMNASVTAIINATNSVETPNTIIMPCAAHAECLNRSIGVMPITIGEMKSQE